jgi:hypothetical protein
LVRGVAEEIAEEFSRRAPQVDPSNAGQDRALPNDGDGNVDDARAPFGGRKHRGRALPQGFAAGGVKDEGVGIRNRGGKH